MSANLACVLTLTTHDDARDQMVTGIGSSVAGQMPGVFQAAVTDLPERIMKAAMISKAPSTIR